MNITEINGGETVNGSSPCNNPVISIQHDNVTVSGFKITGGYPGVEVKGVNTIIEKNNIIRNKYSGDCPNYSGGQYENGQNGMGILVESNTCTIKNNLIVKNGETWNGGGLGIKAISVASLIIENNTISENSGANGGACGSGYGIRVKDSTGKIINNIIVNNDAWDGPGCGVRGYGIYLEGASNFQIDYNNVWDNDDDRNYGAAINYAGTEAGVHDISEDPLFVDTTHYYLQFSSSCVDAGHPNYDYFNEPMPNGEMINLGAFGNTANATTTVPLADAGPDQNIQIGSLVALDGSESRVGSAKPQTYKWTFVFKPEGSNTLLSNSTFVDPTFIADKEGTYQLSLIVSNGVIDSSPDLVTITTIFWEDFKDSVTNNWIPVTGNWSVANENYMVSSTTHNMSTTYYDQDFSSFELEVKVTKIAGEQDNISIFFNGDPTSIASTGNWNNGYKFYYGSGDWQFSKFQNGYRTDIKGWTHSSDLNNDFGVWNILKIVRSSNKIDLYINGVLQGTFHDTTFTSGKIGLGMYDKYKNGQAKFDYVSVKRLND